MRHPIPYIILYFCNDFILISYISDKMELVSLAYIHNNISVIKITTHLKVQIMNIFQCCVINILYPVKFWRHLKRRIFKRLFLDQIPTDFDVPSYVMTSTFQTLFCHISMANNLVISNSIVYLLKFTHVYLVLIHILWWAKETFAG